MSEQCNNKKNILVLGSGGREDAIAWKLRQSPLCNNIYFAPGNGSKREGIQQVPVHIANKDMVAALCLELHIDVLVVGPEQPLVDGLVNFLLSVPDLRKMHIVGPTSKGALLEGSKDFAKNFMEKNKVPTARHMSVTAESLDEGYAFLERLKAPYVLKADGLAAGKGVLILEDLDETKRELKAMLNGKFGDAGKRVLIEEYLHGIECSCFVLTDGDHYKMLPFAKDYKRVGDGDKGLNTGGMGAVSPLPFITDVLEKKIIEKVVEPTIRGISLGDLGYKGFLFIGLMITPEGEPYVIEYNCRMGDPETEVVMPLIDEDLLPDLLLLKGRGLSNGKIKTHKCAASTVILTSGGYPESYKSGYPIDGVEEAEAIEGCTVFHAGTKLKDNTLRSAGGRVLACTAMGKTLEQALERSYKSVDTIRFDDVYCRRDIGQDVLRFKD